MGCVGARGREADLRHHDLLLALLLGLAVAISTPLLLFSRDVPRGGVTIMRPPAVTPAVTVAADITPEADLLLAAPPPGVTTEALAAALTARGYEASAVSLVSAVRVRIPAGADPAAFARRLADTGLLTSVEADVRVRANRLPDDPLLTAQRPYLDAIRAPEGWDVRTSSLGVTIAVVDTGIDITHPDFAGRIVLNDREVIDGRDNDGNGCPDDFFGCTFVSPAAADPSCGYMQPAPRNTAVDDDGHGTFVAGIAAATGNNGRGVTGIAWDARILPVKVLDCTATGRISDAAAGILYAARSGARVIVVAFGSASDARVLRDAVTEATGRYGALVVASVGNERTGRVQYPAAYPGVLAVAGSGVTRDDGIVDYRRPAEFTNYGAEVALFAPAVGLTAPLQPAFCGSRGWACIEGQPYARASGTSFAAPLAAGAAALLFAQHPEATPAFVLGVLRRSVTPMQSGSIAGNAGLLDLAAALAFEPFTAHGAGASHGAYGPPPQGPATEARR